MQLKEKEKVTLYTYKHPHIHVNSDLFFPPQHPTNTEQTFNDNQDSYMTTLELYTISPGHLNFSKQFVMFQNKHLAKVNDSR